MPDSINPIFQQTPVTAVPLVPNGTDLDSIAREAVASKAVLEAESKKNLDAYMAQELEIRVRHARLDITDAAEAARKKQIDDDKKKWHEDVARQNREKEARKKVARQLELKGKLSTLIAAIADAGVIVEEIEDKKCIQIKLLHEAASQLCHSIKWDEAQQ